VKTMLLRILSCLLLFTLILSVVIAYDKIQPPSAADAADDDRFADEPAVITDLLMDAVEKQDADAADTPCYVPETVTKPVDRSKDNMRIGAYLWNGLMSIEGMTNRHMNEFYEYREPLWGYGNPDIEEMEFQIEMAYDFGLDFFAIDYYSSILEAYSNTTVENFVNARNSNLLDFCLLVVDADANTTPTQETWETAMNNYIHYMTMDNALKIDGKPVIIFFLPYNMINCLGGVSATKACFDQMEQEMIKRGYPGIVILGCDSPYGDVNGNIDYNESGFRASTFQNRIAKYESAGFDGFTGYNYRQIQMYRDKNGNKSYETPYTYMTASHENCWKAFADYTDSIYMPCLLGGWDDRPRETELAGYSCYAPDRTKEAFRDHILNAYEWIKDNPNTATDNLAVIYAWDEIDEGGFLIPTKGEGFKMLEGLKEAMDIINADGR